MGRVRPVRDGTLDVDGWELGESDTPPRLGEPVAPGSRVWLVFLIEAEELDEEEQPVLQAERIPVYVLRTDGSSFTGVVLDPPVTPASFTAFSEVRFSTNHVSRQLPRSEAEAAWRQLDARLAAEPRNARLLLGRGQASEKRGALDAAIRDYTAALELDLVSALLARGNAHAVLGNEDAARADFERGLRTASAAGVPEELIEMFERALSMLDYAYGTVPEAEA